MELLKNIYFNTDKLVENTNVKVSYTGKFYQGNSDKVYLHYGYGKNWENVKEVEMKKTDLGYQTELNLAGNDTINFCFKNQNNEWDNNSGKNYVFNIEKASNNGLGTTTFGEPTLFGSEIQGTGVINTMPNTSNIETPTTTPSSFDAIFENIGRANIVNNPSVINIPNVSEPLPNFGIGVNTNTTKSEDAWSLGNTIAVPTGEQLNNIINPIAEWGKAECSDLETVVEHAPVTALVSIETASRNPFGWTKKVKNSVVKFFAAVPKFISGNYKRIIGKHSNK